MRITKKYTPEQQRRIDELCAMAPEQWEKICNGCGVCCLYKHRTMSGRIAYANVCCKYMDCETQKCKIYQNRLTQNFGCNKVDLDTVLNTKLLPRSCGYVEYIFGPAKNPAQIDWSRVRPMSDTEYEQLGLFEILAHVIPGSTRWNQR